ncbi:MAG: ATP synthase F1 subunit gamma [Planctomycetes bacterium]|nr:ATP synthase F1 subunit gamma [Planctomycetota bacterium]
MAQGMKELRRRIRSVTSIQKITRAMEMVATTRLRRMQSKAEGARPYADAIKGFSALLAGGGSTLSSPLTQAREKVGRIAVVVISSDRGLCGAYNANVFRKVSAFLSEKKEVAVDLYTIGKKARVHYARRLPIKESFNDEVEKLGFRRAREIARQMTELFLKGSAAGGVDEVHVVFTRFVSVGRQVTTVDRLLPIIADAKPTDTAGGAKAGAATVAPAAAAGTAAATAAGADVGMLLEPSPQELFDVLMPKSLAMRVFAAMLDSMASEQAQRRMAMKAATDAAGDMIGSLTRKYNRARQETITKELLDIVGGAEALA